MGNNYQLKDLHIIANLESPQICHERALKQSDLL
jgi:hypothetical protein